MFPNERTTGLWHGVVAGFDGTDRARCATRWAARQAADRHRALHLVRVVEPFVPVVAAGCAPILVGPAQERLPLEQELLAEAEACRFENPGLEVHASVHDGVRHETLAAHADSVGADVLVVGASDPGLLSRLVFGSTAAELVRMAKGAVVAVRDPTPLQQATMATGYAPVVAVVDDPVSGPRVLRFAFEAADRWAAQVTVLHVGALRRQLDEWRETHPTVPVRAETILDQPVRTVLEHTQDARLAIVGNLRHGLVHQLLHGSLGHAVLHHAACSVAVIAEP